MKLIKQYLNGEFGLKRTFWFGLVLGGGVLTLLGNSLQAFVWVFYEQDSPVLAIILQAFVILVFIAFMGLAIGV